MLQLHSVFTNANNVVNHHQQHNQLSPLHSCRFNCPVILKLLPPRFTAWIHYTTSCKSVRPAINNLMTTYKHCGCLVSY